MISTLLTSGKAVAASVAAGGIWLAAIVVDETALIPLGSAVAVLVGVWFVSAKFQKVIDGQSETQRRLDLVEKQLKRLPCLTPSCPGEKDK